jgi:hypothetical protein
MITAHFRSCTLLTRLNDSSSTLRVRSSFYMKQAVSLQYIPIIQVSVTTHILPYRASLLPSIKTPAADIALKCPLIPIYELSLAGFTSQAELATYGNLNVASNDLISHRLGRSGDSSADSLHPLTEETCALRS